MIVALDVAALAATIAAGSASSGFPKDDEALAVRAVKIARLIVAEVERTAPEPAEVSNLRVPMGPSRLLATDANCEICGRQADRITGHRCPKHWGQP